MSRDQPTHRQVLDATAATEATMAEHAVEAIRAGHAEVVVLAYGSTTRADLKAKRRGANLSFGARGPVQFDVPYGHTLISKYAMATRRHMFVAIERARGVCVFAAATIAEDDDRRSQAVAAAKAAAGDCERLVAADGIQLLGGIGYTWEHDQQLFVKRAKTSGALFGDAASHRQRIADALGI